MLRKFQNQHGVSLVEVIISAVIFTIAALGMFSTLTMMRSSSDASDLRLGAANYGRQILEDLRAHVDQEAFDPVLNDYTNDLSLGHHQIAGPGGLYTADYDVTMDAIGVRRVDLNITWQE